VVLFGDVQKPAEGVQFRFGMSDEQCFDESSDNFHCIEWH
jgi:hypothetical protein